MQFSKILVAATTIALTCASPVEIVARQTNICGQNQISNCCSQLQSQVTNFSGFLGNFVVPTQVGLNCIANVDSCNSDQTAVCCAGNTVQTANGDATFHCY